ncbi:MAG TPA: hypothetical protein VKN76_05025, partial [Kiloniellaceae bacterium]|nr:hypothetical protein [Kiloniellaceae bacterium]
MNVNVLGARFRSWSLRLFLAMSLMAASGAVAEAGAASGNATTVEGSNGNAYVVVLPQTMSPAERDALLQSILAGKGTEAPVEEAESQGLLAAIDEDLRKVWEAVVAALENFDLAPQVPLHVLEVLAASRGGEATGLFVMTLFAVVFLGAAAVELCFRRFLWKPIPVPPEAAVARYTDRMKLALRWLLRDVIALAVFWGAAAVLFSAIYHLQDPGRQIVVSIVATVILVRFIIGVSNFILAPGAPSRRLAAFGDADASSSYAYFVVLVSAAALFLKPGTLVDRIGGVDPSARAAYGLIFGGIVLILSIILLRRLRRPVCEAVLAAGPKPEAPTAFRRWAAHSWHHFATAAFLAVYCITLFFRVFDADGNVTGSALGTMALILLTPFCMRSLRLLLNDYCTKRTEERHLAPTALRGSFEVALQRMIPVIVLVAALIVLGQLWGVSVFNLESLGIGARIYDAIVDIGIILIVAYFVWELVRGAIDQRLAEEHGSGVGADGSGGEDAEHAPASRISTLLPLFRTTLLIVMVLV